MIVRCSYCNTDLCEKEPLDQKDISHTICDECFEYFNKQITGQDLCEYLDRFEKPVLVVNQEGRVIAFNKLFSRTLGKSYRNLIGARGGEALECEYARLPEGCGNTVHCQTCTIRNTVEKTLITGESQIKVPAYLYQDGQYLDLEISAYKNDDTVRVVVEKVQTSKKSSISLEGRV